MREGGGRRLRFTAVAAASLCAVVLFSAFHMLRLNVHLVERQRARPAGISTGSAAPDGAEASSAGAHAHRTTGTQNASTQSPGAVVGAPAAVAGAAGEGTIFGHPRNAFVRAADEAEIRARDCPGRRPFHTLLTVQDRMYMQWQTYLAWYHFVKQQKSDFCTDMVAMTRLLASADGKPDGLMALMPTHVSAQLGHDKTRGFQVINRPWSVLQFLQSPMYKERVLEEYVLILEGDHILLRPIPNRATPDTPVGFFFPYSARSRARSRVLVCARTAARSTTQPPDRPIARRARGARRSVARPGTRPPACRGQVVQGATRARAADRAVARAAAREDARADHLRLVRSLCRAQARPRD